MHTSGLPVSLASEPSCVQSHCLDSLLVELKMAAGTLLPPALRKPFTFVTDKRIRQYLLRYGKKEDNIMDSMPEISRHKHSAGFQTRLTTDCVNYVVWNIGKAAVWCLSHMQFITITWANVRETLLLIVLDNHVNEITVPWLQCKVRSSTYIYSYIWSNIIHVSESQIKG